MVILREVTHLITISQIFNGFFDADAGENY